MKRERVDMHLLPSGMSDHSSDRKINRGQCFRQSLSERGKKYAEAEILHPVRIVTTTVPVTGGTQPRVSVKNKEKKSQKRRSWTVFGS